MACRGIIVEDGKILVSYERLTGQLSLPGGGLEDGETEQECCIREVAEETGLKISVSDCVLEIDEYYEEWKFISYYYLGEVIGKTEIHLTDNELRVGMTPRWFSIEEVMDVFSHHQDYAATDEMRRGMYLREYRALCAVLDEM